MSGDLGRLLGAEGLGNSLERLRDAVAPTAVIPGWGTVELDRGEHEVGAGPGTNRRARAEDVPQDELLGAAARRLRWSDGRDLVLLEPSREGPLAASLARFGEGVLALYLLADAHAAGRARSAGFALSATGATPLGMGRRVLTGPFWGPHLIVVSGDASSPAATIGR